MHSFSFSFSFLFNFFWQVQFLQFPSTLLQPLGTILYSSYATLRSTSISRVELLYISSALVFTSGDPFFVAATQGMALDHLALEARGLYISGSYGIITTGKIVLGSLPLPGHCTDNKLKHLHSL